MIKSYVAGGTIQPATFVIIDTSNPAEQVVAASANTQFMAGIAQESSESAPIPGATTQAAVLGDPIKVYGIGEICLLQATTAGWTTGDKLTSNASGQGVTAGSAQAVGAIAQETVSGAVLGRVEVYYGWNS